MPLPTPNVVVARDVRGRRTRTWNLGWAGKSTKAAFYQLKDQFEHIFTFACSLWIGRGINCQATLATIASLREEEKERRGALSHV